MDWTRFSSVVLLIWHIADNIFRSPAEIKSHLITRYSRCVHFGCPEFAALETRSTRAARYWEKLTLQYLFFPRYISETIQEMSPDTCCVLSMYRYAIKNHNFHHFGAPETRTDSSISVSHATLTPASTSGVRTDGEVFWKNNICLLINFYHCQRYSNVSLIGVVGDKTGWGWLNSQTQTNRIIYVTM